MARKQIARSYSLPVAQHDWLQQIADVKDDSRSRVLRDILVWVQSQPDSPFVLPAGSVEEPTVMDVETEAVNA